MRRWLCWMALLVGSAGVSLAQTATTAAPAKVEGGGSVIVPAEADTDELKVKERLQQEAARRRKEKAELLEKLAKAEMDLKINQARQVEQQKEDALLDRDVVAAQQRMNEAYTTLSAVSAEYDAAEKKDKDGFVARIVGGLQGKYDEEFRVQKANHERDMAFVEKNKWRPEDFDNLTIRMDNEDKGRTLTLNNSKGHAVVGSFPTMDFATGKKTWHAVPTGAIFTAYIQRENPFVADVVVSFGTDYMGSGSTNRLDWDAHVYLGKDFAKGEGDAARFRLVAVSWPVDLAHRQCWQAGTAPVFEPVPMPLQRTATGETPDIASKIADWKFADEGLIKKKQDAVNSSRNSKLYYEKLQQGKSAKHDRYTRRLEDLKEKEKDLKKKVDEIKAMLVEYEEDVRVSERPAPPPPVVTSTNATEGL